MVQRSYVTIDGFHMIGAIAAIAKMELKSISAIVVAAIAGEWFSYHRYNL